MSKTVNYNGTNYEVIKIDDNEIIYSDGKNIYSIDRNTGLGVYNTGKGSQDIYRIAAAFNPKSFNPDTNLLDIIWKAANMNNRVGKAFQHSYGIVYVLPTPYNSCGYDDVECLLLERKQLKRITVYPGEFGSETKMTEFLKELRLCVASLIVDNSLTEKILKEIK